MSEAENAIAGKGRTYILESMPVNKAIWILAIPTMVAMLIQVVYNMTDTFFIGKLNDPNMVAAISIVMPIFMLIQAFGNIFAIGGASLISRLLGRGEGENASRAGSVSFWSALVVSTFVSVIGIIFLEPILMMCGASVNTIGYGKSYLFIMLLGGPFIGMQMALGGLLRSEGATRQSMTGMIAGSVLNMILDPLFILVLHMGVAGAALGTTIGNIAGFSYYMWFYRQKRSIVSISIKHFSTSGNVYADIFKIGIPASVGMILLSMGFALANVFAVGFSDDVVAAYGVVMRITNITVMLSIGLAQGCQPLMGYSYGAKNYSRLLDTIKRGVTIGIVMCTVFAVAFFAFSETWIRIFINNDTVIGLGVKTIRAFVFGMPFLGPQMVLMTMFQSLGKTTQSLVIALGRQGLFFIPALFVFSSLWGFNGFIFALPFSDIATVSLSFTLFLIMRKKLHLARRESE